MIGGPNSGTSVLYGIYNSNNQAILDSLTRIASGKRVRVPSDDFAGYARASSLQSDVTAYEAIKRNVLEVKGFADYAGQYPSWICGAALWGFFMMQREKDMKV